LVNVANVQAYFIHALDGHRLLYLDASESSELGAQSDGECIAAAADSADVLVETFRQRAPVAERTPERVAASPHTQTHTPMQVKGKGSSYSITERRVPELIPVLGSQLAGNVSHKPGGRLPLLSARPAVTPRPLFPLRGLLPVLLLGEQRHDRCEQFA